MKPYYSGRLELTRDQRAASILDQLAAADRALLLNAFDDALWCCTYFSRPKKKTKELERLLERLGGGPS